LNKKRSKTDEKSGKQKELTPMTKVFILKSTLENIASDNDD